VGCETPKATVPQDARQSASPPERQWSSTRSNLEGCGRRTFERLHQFLPVSDAIVVRLVECKHVHARACLHSRPHLRAFVCIDTSPSARSWCRLCAGHGYAFCVEYRGHLRDVVALRVEPHVVGRVPDLFEDAPHVLPRPTAHILKDHDLRPNLMYSLRVLSHRSAELLCMWMHATPEPR